MMYEVGCNGTFWCLLGSAAVNKAGCLKKAHLRSSQLSVFRFPLFLLHSLALLVLYRLAPPTYQSHLSSSEKHLRTQQECVIRIDEE